MENKSFRFSVLIWCVFSAQSLLGQTHFKTNEQLIGTSWFCEEADFGILFKDSVVCFLLDSFSCTNLNGKGLSLLDIKYYRISHNQFWIYDTERELYCDDGLFDFYCAEIKFAIEHFTGTSFDIQVIWKDSIFPRYYNPYLPKMHFERNTTLPIVEEEFFNKGEAFVTDSTIQLPRVEIRMPELEQIITEFCQPLATKTDSVPFIEVYSHIKNDSLIVMITDDVSLPYNGKIKENSVIALCDSIPVLLIGNLPKQVVSHAITIYPLHLCINKYVSCKSIDYEPCNIYLKRGRYVKKIIPLK